MAAVMVDDDPIADLPLARRQGLDPDAVREVLVRVTRERDEAIQNGRDTFMEVERANASLREVRSALEAARSELETLRGREASVGEALVTANGVAREIKEQAAAEAARVASEARAEAEAVVSRAKADADEKLRSAAQEAAQIIQDTRSRLATFRDEEAATVAGARQLAARLRDLAGGLDAALEGLESPREPAGVSFGEVDGEPAAGGVPPEATSGEQASTNEPGMSDGWSAQC